MTQCSSRNLDGIDAEREQLAAAESASYQHGQDGAIPLAAERVAICTRKEPLVLLRREPVPNTNANPAHSFDTPNPGRKFRTQEAGIGGLIRDPADGCQAQIDRRWCVPFLFQKDPVSQDDGAIECEARV